MILERERTSQGPTPTQQPQAEYPFHTFSLDTMWITFELVQSFSK